MQEGGIGQMKYRIAIYMRLSCDDGDCDAESNSIANQRQLLRSYVAQHFTNYELKEYQDDGFTGTNFNRPSVTELLNDVKQGVVHCIIVKDLSRFSRDYIDIGSYLEQIFPFAGVRFIAIGDGYDSDDYKGNIAGMDTSFKNLINDLYCKDISVKVKSALSIKKEKGIYVNGSCTFGYRKDPSDKHILLIDEEEAAIVRRIFQMTAEGVSSHKIAQIFNAEGVKTPIEYKMERGIVMMKPKGGHFEWSGSTICQMLRNATYAGDFVYNKYETPEVSGKARLRPRSEWKIFRNHHEAIVDRETFEFIQQSRGTKKTVKYERHPLIGKMECGRCHKSLNIARSKNPYFFCGNRYVTRYEGCVRQVNVQFLEQYILFKLQEEADKQELQHVYSKTMEEAKAVLVKAVKEKGEIDRKVKALQAEQMRIYEAYAFRKIDRAEYLEKKENLQEQIINQNCMLSEVAERIERMRQILDMEELTLYEYVKSNGLSALTKDVVNRFVKRIVIYDENHIEVEWNYSEKLSEKLLQYQFAIM